MRKNVFIIGLDQLNREMLEGTRQAEFCTFHSLIPFEEIRGSGEIPVDKLLTEAEQTLDAHDGTVDAVASFWDFPMSEMIPILRRHLGHPTPSLESIFKCHHKYWSRLEQQSSVPEHTPLFAAVDPFEDPAEAVDLPYPFWLKPVRSYRSHLGFRITNREDLDRALTRIRAELPRIGEPFDRLLERVESPEEVARRGGHACIAEQLIGGRQCTIEGYAYGGEVEIYGTVDTIRDPSRSTFARYDHPSTQSVGVRDRMAEIARRFVTHIGYHNAPFNIEFFYDAKRDKIWLLEMNTRISQSHSTLFNQVDGASNHEVMLDLALGREPRFPYRQGPFRRAAKCLLRAHADAVVRRVPSACEIRELEQRYPGTKIAIEVSEGTRLSELPDQDAYSYELGAVYVGASTRRELLKTFREIRSALRLELDDPSPCARTPAAGAVHAR